MVATQFRHLPSFALHKTQMTGMKYRNYVVLIASLAVIFSSCGQQGPSSEAPSEEDIMAQAKEIHDRVLTLDTHCDIRTSNFTEEVNYTQDLSTQVTLPKMEEGGLDVAWFIVYTGQEELDEAGYTAAYENAMDKFSAIHRLCEEIAPERIELALTSEDARRIASSGKKVAMIGIENGYPVGLDIDNVKKFYDLGGRYMSLAHNGHSQLSDSNTGERDGFMLHNGLSPLGEEVIAEMNKWGMMIDVSHPSKAAMAQMIELTKAPIIASHSSARALSDHSRNLDDEQLMWMKENGGVVQTVALATYVNIEKHEAYNAVADSLIAVVAEERGFTVLSRREAYQLPDEERTQYFATERAIREEVEPQLEELGAEPVNVSDFVDHIDYMVEKMGIDHVGISSDFDGGGGIEGWDDASETFNVTLELVRRGYTEEEISKLWSGNLLRVLDEVQRVAREIQESEEINT